MTTTTERSAERTDLTREEAHFLVRVTGREVLAEGVVALTLEAPDGAALPSWRPGAHIDLLFGDGLIRQYSLCGDPADRTSYRVAVLLQPDGRGGSRRVHEHLQVGEPLEVRGPRNHFPLVAAERYLFLAGGIGITPIKAMIGDLEREGRPWSLVYGGRRRASMAFAEELAARGPHVELWPEDERGLIDLAAVLSDPAPGTALYTCGPEPLLRAVEDHCTASWHAGSLHLERFSPKEIETEGDRTFAIELAQDGRVLTVPAGRSALEVLEEAGIDILSSCREGTCGTCEVAIVRGEAEHRDSVLTSEEQAENSCMMVCVSRSACPRLVLDL